MSVSNQEMIRWYRTPIPREELRRLTSRSDLLGLAQSVGFLALVSLSAAIAWIAWDAAKRGAFPVWGVVALVFLHGTLWNFQLQGFHELVHYTVFRTKWLGTLFLGIYSFIGWHNPFHFRASHTRHHVYTLHPPRDREVVLPIGMRLRHYLRVAFVDPYGLYRRLRHFGTNAAGRFDSEWQRDIFTEDGPVATARLFWWARFVLAGHAAIIIVSILTGAYQLAVLISFGNFYARWLQFLCNESQRIGLSDNIPDFRLCCRTFTANPVIRFLYWNMNFHTEHHMYAAVPCYRLPALHRAVRHELPPWPRGLVSTWRQIMMILKRQRQDPSYRFVPELP